jgi:hypothetical protein
MLLWQCSSRASKCGQQHSIGHGGQRQQQQQRMCKLVD